MQTGFFLQTRKDPVCFFNPLKIGAGIYNSFEFGLLALNTNVVLIIRVHMKAQLLPFQIILLRTVHKPCIKAVLFLSIKNLVSSKKLEKY